MERSNRNELEEIALEDLHIQDIAVCRAQDIDVDGLQSDKRSQNSGDATQKESSKLDIRHETLIQEKEPTKKDTAEDSLQKSKKSEPSDRELTKDEEMELKTDTKVLEQQKDESSYALVQDSSERNQLTEAGAIYKERDAFEDKLLESDGNATVQRIAETPDNILLVTEQKSIQGDNDATHQECGRSVDGSLLLKSPTNSTEQLTETLINSMDDPLQEAASNGTIQEESDGTTESDQHLQENGPGPESHVCLRTQHLEDDASGPLPRRTCHHRACNPRHHIMQQSTLPPLPEDPEPPLEPFEVEIEVRRHRRMLGIRMPTLPIGMVDYMRRVRDRYIPPEMQAFCEEFQRRYGKFLFGILIGILITMVFYYIIYFLESRYDSDNYFNITSPWAGFGANLNSFVSSSIPEFSVTDLDIIITTPMADLDA